MALGEPFRKEVKVKVKKSEQESKKDELVQVDREINETLAAKAAEMADYNDTLKKLRDQQRKLLGVINDGEETIEVECVEEADERRMEVKTIRKDTGEVIDRRPMTAEERQTTIGDAIAKNASKARGRKPKGAAPQNAEPAE